MCVFNCVYTTIALNTIISSFLRAESLPQVSQIISNSINAATDALTQALDTVTADEKEKLLPLFRDHLPQTLANLSFDRHAECVPEQYIKNAIASCLASKMVYKEGTKFVDSHPKEKLAKVALKYIEKENEVAKLKEALVETEMPEAEKEMIIKLLEAGGARTALSIS